MSVTVEEIISDSQSAEVFEAMKGLRPPRHFSCDGCTASPDNLFGVDLRPACVIHDYEYAIGGNESSRLIADKNLRDNIKTCVAMSDDRVKWLAPVYAYAAGAYYRAVRRLGVARFAYQRPLERWEVIARSLLFIVTRYFGR